MFRIFGEDPAAWIQIHSVQIEQQTHEKKKEKKRTYLEYICIWVSYWKSIFFCDWQRSKISNLGRWIRAECLTLSYFYIIRRKIGVFIGPGLVRPRQTRPSPSWSGSGQLKHPKPKLVHSVNRVGPSLAWPGFHYFSYYLIFGRANLYSNKRKIYLGWV